MGSGSASRHRVEKGKFRVLHADDSDDFAFLVARALRMAGFHEAPVHCPNGERAIDQLSKDRDHLPDAILLDVNMPGRNGFEVLEWVRQQPVLDEVPVVMLTSSSEPSDRDRAAQLGATKFLVKAGNLKEVVATMETFLGSPAAS
jgi:CheY-like chemotaxis protein